MVTSNFYDVLLGIRLLAVSLRCELVRDSLFECRTWHIFSLQLMESQQVGIKLNLLGLLCTKLKQFKLNRELSCKCDKHNNLSRVIRRLVHYQIKYIRDLMNQRHDWKAEATMKSSCVAKLKSVIKKTIKHVCLTPKRFVWTQSRHRRTLRVVMSLHLHNGVVHKMDHKIIQPFSPRKACFRKISFDFWWAKLMDPPSRDGNKRHSSLRNNLRK